MEPYERNAAWVTVMVLIAFLVALAMGANPAASVGYLFGVLALVWVSPLFVDRIKHNTPNHHLVGNLGLKSCFNPKPLASTADDPEMPGLALYTYGGGGGSGFHLKDGGTGFNSGGYFYEPIDAAIELQGGKTAHPCLFQEVDFDTLLPQFQAVVMENGYHPTNSRFHGALVHVGSVKPPSQKVLNDEAVMHMKDQVASQARHAAGDSMGQAASTMDLIRAIVDTQKPLTKRAKKVLGMADEGEEPPNGT